MCPCVPCWILRGIAGEVILPMPLMRIKYCEKGMPVLKFRFRTLFINPKSAGTGAWSFWVIPAPAKPPI